MIPVLVFILLLKTEYSNQQVTPDEDCIFNDTKNGSTYVGNISITENGTVCVKWSDVTNNTAGYYERHNYCRNPNKLLRPWCYTATSYNQWKYCDVPYCECRQSTTDLLYSGKVSTTRFGNTCLFWNKGSRYTNETSNYCRTPEGDADNDGGPWCYLHGGWGRCNVPVCRGAACPDISKNHLVSRDKKTIYRYGEIAFIISCEPGYQLIGQNIHTTLVCQQSGQWNSSMPICEDCRKSTSDLLYSGWTNTTRNGHTCRFWNTTEYYINETLNYCRTPENNTENDGGPWCYTQDGWDRCNVPVCGGATCPDISNNNLVTRDKKTTYRYGEIAIVSCEPGYQLKGHNTETPIVLACQHSGQWNSSIPTCKAVSIEESKGITYLVYGISISTIFVVAVAAFILQYFYLMRKIAQSNKTVYENVKMNSGQIKNEDQVYSEISETVQ